MNAYFDSFLFRAAVDLCLACATLGCCYLVIANLLVRRLAQASRSSVGMAVPVTVLKPLHGDEPGLLSRLGALYQQDYDGPVQVICGCQSRNDPAVPVVRELAAVLPPRSLELVIDSREHGSNPKISNLINMAAVARHDMVIITDSDIEIGPHYLSDITAALQRPGVGAVTCLYHGVPSGSWASVLSAMAINLHFLPNVLIAIASGLARPCFGSTIALRRETLARIGGLRAFADCLADDHAIGEAVRSVGLSVAIPPFSLGHVCHERTFGEFFRHQLRAARTIRSIDAAGYVGAVISNPLPLALVGSLSPGSGGLLLACTALICRVALCRTVERTLNLPRQPYALLPVTDLVLFLVYATSFLGSTVTWRGHRYQVMSNGTLSQDGRELGHDANAVPPGPLV